MDFKLMYTHVLDILPSTRMVFLPAEIWEVVDENSYTLKNNINFANH